MPEHDPATSVRLDWADLPSTPGGTSGPLPPTAFGAGRFIAATFSTWARNALAFCTIGVVAAIPSAVVAWFTYRDLPFPSVDRAHPFANVFQGWSRMLVTMGVSIVFTSVVTGAVVRGTVERLRGVPVTVGDMLAVALRRYLPVLVVILLSTVVVMGTACTVVVPAIVGTGWSVAAPAAALEGRGPVEALRRSWALTRGLRWRIFGGYLVVLLPALAVTLPVQLLVGLVVGEGATYGERMATTQAVSQLTGGVMASLSAAAMGVAYHQLREAAEGTDSDQLGRVFE